MATSNSLHGFTSRSENTLNSSCMKFLNLSDRNGHSDLLAFLSQAQTLDVDMLSLMWYSSQQVGKGGFAKVNQSLIHEHFSFAVKRLLEDYGRCTGDERVESVMTEVAILTHSRIAKHPHIITLEGVCWEVNHFDEMVTPVLVFDKAQMGDLMHFINTDKGRSLSLEDRIDLCQQIAKALEVLHTSCVIHCDLKPENILVFDGGSGPIAKISDFGSSIIVDQENSLYELPVSEPWTAPEHHHRGVFADQAYGMDLYRLVLICLWLLLDCIGDRNTVGPTALLRAMKQSGRLRDAAMEYMKSSTLDPAIMTRLSDIFQASLTENPAERHFTLADVIRSLTLHGYPNLILEQDCADSSREVANPPYIVPVSHSRYHVDFNISYNLYPLLYTNYLVRKVIFQCLEHKAETTECKRCRQKSRFQLAFCYYIGFGTARNLELALEWAKKCKKTLEDLEDETDEVVDMHVIKNKATNQLQLSGFDISMDHVNEYRKPDYQLTQVVENYQREISDLEKAFPDQPLIVAVLQATTAALLGGSGKWQQSSQKYRSVITFFRQSRDHGPTHHVTLNLSHRLAELLRLQGQLEDAKSIMQEVLAAQKHISEAGPQALLCYSMLGMIYHDENNYDEASKIFEDVLKASTQLLGSEHSQVLHAMSNLASAYRAKGRLDEAEELDHTALERKRKILDSEGRPHYSTLTSGANLALTYSYQGRWDEAEKLEQWVLEERLKALGPLDPATLTAQKNLASTYLHQGRTAEAEKQYREVVEGQQRILGEAHPQTLDSIETWTKVRGDLAQATL